MHPNEVLLTQLYGAEHQHQHREMAACYRPEATFHDIAFDLRGSRRIHGMWHMICETDIQVELGEVEADDGQGRASIVCKYTFGRDEKTGKKGRPVRNVIQSRFLFKDGKILRHQDQCDAKVWAQEALGGPLGFIAGRVRFLRSLKANQKLDGFLEKHAEYR